MNGKLRTAKAIAVASAIAFVGVLLQSAVFDGPGASFSADPVRAATESGVPKAVLDSYPARLIIPSIGLDASVEDIGTTASGDIGSPYQFDQVAWYDHSAVPGKPGVALIDGHVDNGLGLPGAFKRLDELSLGAKIEIVFRNGDKRSFVAVATTSYSYDANASNLLHPANKTLPYLVLVTCEGTWLSGQKTYDRRLAVIAELQPISPVKRR